jgi:hypothetical protein
MPFIITPYIDVPTAQLYFNNRLNSDAWCESSPTDQLKALSTATSLINNLKFTGIKFDPTQSNEFPRKPDLRGFIFDYYYDCTVPVITPVIPDEILIATCEIAISLLDSLDLDVEIGNLNTQIDKYATVHLQKDTSVAQEHTRAGIPSATAWLYLKQFLVDPRAPFSLTGPVGYTGWNYL